LDIITPERFKTDRELKKRFAELEAKS
jgi:hypothetical protein